MIRNITSKKLLLWRWTCTRVSWVRHCWCPIQLLLTDSPVVLIKAIRRHRAVRRAPHPYRFDSATASSRVFWRVVWSLGRTRLRAVPDRLPRGPPFTMHSGRNCRILALIFIAQATWFHGVCLRPPTNFRIKYQRGKKRIRIRIF